MAKKSRAKCPAKGCKWEGTWEQYMKHYKKHYTPKKEQKPNKRKNWPKPPYARKK